MVKATWGTVTTVLMTEVVVQVSAGPEAAAWSWPSSIWLTAAPVFVGQGRVTVVETEMVVAGAADGAGVPAGAGAGA